MRNLLHCRRGSVAFGVLAAMLPLIGAVALGTETGSWYAIQRDAQNAADAAAMAGAYWLVNADAASMSASATPFATRNGFLASEVTISQPASNQSKAVIVRSQPQLLTKLFYTAPASGNIAAGNVQIGATAVAQVYTLSKPCLLALTGSITFQGSPTVNAPACGMVSDNTTASSIDFTGGSGINVSNVGSISGAGGCSGNTTLCSGVLTYGIPETDPYAALNTVLSSLAMNNTNFPGASCATPGPVAYSTNATATKCYNGTPGHGNGNAGGYAFPSATLNGTYFFAGPVTISGSITITGTATLILLPGASLSITGNPTVQLTGQTSVASTSVPPAISGASNASTLLSLMAGLLIYDPETTTGNGSGSLVNITGNSGSYFDGVVYAPHAAVEYTGSSSTSGVGVGCNEVIAASVKYAGNTTYLSNTNCPMPTAPIQYVALVQ